MPGTASRRRMRRRYRRLAAALAGVAVMSSAGMPWLPVAKVVAAPSASYSTTQAATTSADPVQVVMDNAATFGFDAENDRFSLLSKTDDKAVVRVRSHGQTFKVDLERAGEGWRITVIRGIGDMTRPATYTPASFFPGAALPTAPTAPAEQTVLYENDSYNDWSWREASYPRDMDIGLSLFDPRLAGVATAIPGSVLDKTDFGRQLLLFARLGPVADKGYGIAISRVAQAGNDLTVTVRTKSPAVGGTLEATKGDDYLAVDRTGLDFTRPIHVTFVDQYGTILITYTITPR